MDKNQWPAYVRSMGLRESRGNPNEIFPVVVTTPIKHFDVSRILINNGSSCDIMHTKIFEKMNFYRGSLRSYEGSNLQIFNGTTTLLWGYVDLMIFVEDSKDIWFVDSKFHVVAYRSVYNFILWRPFATTLNVVASSVYLKLKQHNLQRESVAINVDLEGANIIYQAFHKDQWKWKAMKTNMASLTG